MNFYWAILLSCRFLGLKGTVRDIVAGSDACMITVASYFQIPFLPFLGSPLCGLPSRLLTLVSIQEIEEMPIILKQIIILNAIADLHLAALS